MRLFERILPKSLSQYANTTIGQSAGLILLATFSIASVLVLIYWHHTPSSAAAAADMRSLLSDVFVVFTLIAGVTAWIVVLAHRSRQSAFRETAHHMEKLVEEIAAHEVTDGRLQHAKQIAEDANRAKSRFLVSVSHEIRSPLNSIYGYAQLLEKGGVGTPENAGRVIRRSSEHLSNLVEGLMEMSQVEGGVLKLERDIVNFPDFLDQIADMLRPQTRAKGLNFVYDPAKNLPEYVRTDPKRLRQILINILSNAIKFTPRGDIVFRISYRSEIAHFEISDTGVGISPDNINRIFEPFERVDQIGPSKAPGIGLGLSIARVLAHVMGAEITVESKVGAGTSFRVRAMLSRPMKDDIDKRHRREAVDAEIGHEQKVLMIDDDPNQLALVSSFLAPQGYQIAAFGNVASGLKAAENFSPDIALLDVNMPDQSGWDAAESLRARYGVRLYIVMISADAQSAKTHDPKHELH
ncbi:MAG: hybrid sensor histidine kinase/response regulator, partial [Pseudomonadota bacterium]